MRIAIVELYHETNVFNSRPTTLSSFEETRGIFRKEEVIERFEGIHSPLGGVIDFAHKQGFDMIPVLSAAATPGGTVTSETYRRLKSEILAGISASLGSIDGICVSLHGAMVAEDQPDAEGDLLSSIRRLVGNEMPIVAVLDLHANISPKMISSINYVTITQTYPHVDHFERGREAGRHLFEIARGREKPVLWLEKLPLAPPGISQVTSMNPMRSILAKAGRLKRRNGILDVLVATGFELSDVPEVGFSIIVIADRDLELAKSVCQRLAEDVWALRRKFLVEVLDPAEAISKALDSSEKPVLVADVGDNPGGGGTGANTRLIRELLRQGASPSSFAVIADPEAARVLSERGVGAQTTVSIGEILPDTGRRLSVTGIVRRLCNGTYVNSGPMRHGDAVHMGKTVLLDSAGVKIIVCENAVQPWDPEVFRHVGIDPATQAILVVKSAVHFRAGFEALTPGGILLADTGGLTSPVLSSRVFTRIPRPIWPLDAC